MLTVTWSAGSVWCTCPDQEPPSAAGIVGVADGAGDDILADAARLTDVDRGGLSSLPLWCMTMTVPAAAIATTHAAQAVTQPTRRAVDRVRAGNSSVALPAPARGTPRAAARDRLVPSARRPAAGSLRPSSAVTTFRAASRLAGSGARQAATVARNGSGRKFRSCGPMAGAPRRGEQYRLRPGEHVRARRGRTVGWGDAVVHDPRAVGAEHHVIRPEIPMHQPGLVNRGEAGGRTHGQRRQFGFLESPLVLTTSASDGPSTNSLTR